MKVNVTTHMYAFKIVWVCTILCGFCGVSQGQLLSIRGDFITLLPQNQPLPKVLGLFAQQGVEINIDPAIDSRVTEDLIEIHIEDALELLLKDYGHVTSWELVDGPVGQLPKLSSIDVYRKGYAHAVRRLVVEAGGIRVIQDPRGFAYSANEFLIGVKEGTTLEQFKDLVAAVGGVVTSSISNRGVYRVKLPSGSDVLGVVARLENHPRVAAVEPNYVVESPDPQPQAEVSALDSKTTGSSVGLPKAREGASAVAVLDTGLSSQVDMGDLVKGVHDAINPGAEVGDTTGHGTQMALIASGAIQPTGAMVPGEGSGTPVLAVKAFDDDGVTTNFGLMEAIQYAVKNDARVLSLSWGTAVGSEFLQDSIVSAQERDLLVVAAVGNEATGQPSFPAAYDGVIGVGALDSSGSLWEHSNYGEFVDLVAPGHAEFPIGHDGPPGSYVGTSISTAYVAGYLSQLISDNPEASSQQIVDKLYQDVSDAGVAGRDARYGRGTLSP